MNGSPHWILVPLALLTAGCGLLAPPTFGQRLPIDEQLIQAAGLRLLRSEHMLLITDIRGRDDIDELGKVFDQAVPQWCEYFGVSPLNTDRWRAVACLIGDKDKFQQAQLLPGDLPPFPAGYQRGGDIWLFVQPGDYYTRHLLLHEGTHAFMEEFLGGFGPPWYAEGMAELLALHRWKDQVLHIRQPAADREAFPYWGRVKIIRQASQEGRAISMDEVMEISNESFRQVESYAWAWAACEFFDSHPDFQATFRKLKSTARLEPEIFNRTFRSQLNEHWNAVQNQWQWMIEEIDYGYDVARAKPVPVADRRTDGAMTTLSVSAERGWQATGIAVEIGQILRFESDGEFQIKHDGQAWPCQADGITLEYYRGHPLGRLMAAVNVERQIAPMIHVGRENEIRFEQAGQLYLRVNESPAHWQDNRGVLTVRVTSKSD